jgi:hypothetical protein
MRRALVVFLTLLLLWAVVGELNHAVSPLHFHLWVAGLFVTFSALTLPLRAGLTATLMAGMVCDATAPVVFGTQAVLFTAAHVVIFNVRDRIPEETVPRVVVALLTNVALFLIFSCVQIYRLPSATIAWPRLLVDLICSQLFIALIAPWFFAVQTTALRLALPLTTYYGRRHTD